ncbi:SDR family NAD(P)-dependent oxidoreductase [Haloechinothrix halophila]|uniref:SDR family NAD(P)-dependent oxidoreductase n=1 Tax=Haloechinothrix halophila TaxID=1069073 RepID=UPI001E565270|nr:SDR family NAD(P)-dependent oxidoreductase [Haloechinothrix halophila]
MPLPARSQRRRRSVRHHRRAADEDCRPRAQCQLPRPVPAGPRAPAAATQNCDGGPQRGAKIVPLSSITGVASEAQLAAYAASKAALISLCETLNLEESGNGVSATAVSPGYVDTDMATWKEDQISR